MFVFVFALARNHNHKVNTHTSLVYYYRILFNIWNIQRVASKIITQSHEPNPIVFCRLTHTLLFVWGEFD